jgi:hypothetical protein
MKMAGVEVVEDMTEVEVMTGIKGTKSDVKKERRASLLSGSSYFMGDA